MFLFRLGVPLRRSFTHSIKIYLDDQKMSRHCTRVCICSPKYDQTRPDSESSEPHRPRTVSLSLCRCRCSEAALPASGHAPCSNQARRRSNVVPFSGSPSSGVLFLAALHRLALAYVWQTMLWLELGHKHAGTGRAGDTKRPRRDACTISCIYSSPHFGMLNLLLSSTLRQSSERHQSLAYAPRPHTPYLDPK